MEFCLLGPLTVRSGETVLPISRGKQRALLGVLLARAGQVVPVDELIELIWAGSPPRCARATLLNHVKRLREALGQSNRGKVRRSGPGYLIDAAPGEVDLSRFGGLCAGGGEAVRQGNWEEAVAQLSAALSLWRGQPFLDVPCPVLAVSEVPRLTELRVMAVEDRIDAELHLGRHCAVITELRQHVLTEPLRERGHALLMLALYRAGRPADALSAYQAARRELVGELGLEPGAELRLLHQQILTADPGLDLGNRPGSRPAQRPGRALASAGPPPAVDGAAGTAGAGWREPVPRQVPAAGRCFVGRERELRALGGLLDRAAQPPGAAVICVITGGAGIGKSTLAAHWAHQVADRFPDGQFYVDLHGFGTAGPVDPAGAVRELLGALQIPAAQIPSSRAAQGGLYRSLLAARRALVLLDNAADASQVRPLLPAGPGCMAVITSRNRLTGLAAAEGAQLLTLDPLTHDQAHDLLAARLGTQRLAGEAHATAELIRLCAGLPLALAIAAARITASPGLPIASVTRELTDARSRLDALDTGDPATSARTVFSWSYRTLPGPAARMFQLIGQHSSPQITLPAAARLAGLPERDAQQLLTELTQACLATEHAPGQFTIHPLIHAYATEQSHTHPVGKLPQPGPVPAAPQTPAPACSHRPTSRPAF